MKTAINAKVSIQPYGIILILILSFFSRLQAQEMPFDPETKKVSYRGEVSVNNKAAGQIYQELGKAISTITNFRGQVNGLFFNAETRTIDGTISILVTDMMKSRIIWINATLQLKAKDNAYEYTFTDFYLYAAGAANMYAQNAKDEPIEQSTFVDIGDIKKKGNNSTVCHENIEKVISELAKRVQ